MSNGQRAQAMVLARTLTWDVGVPVVAYYSLHVAGFGDWLALLAATVAAGLVLLAGLLRDRAFNSFAVVMLAVFGIGLVLALVSGDPRFLLVKDSITTAVIGAAFLVSAACGRPLTLAAAQRWEPAHAAELAARYRTNPLARRIHLVSSVIWGAGLLAEASLRVMLIFLLPVSVMVGLSTVLMITTVGILIVCNGWYVKRERRRALHNSSDMATANS